MFVSKSMFIGASFGWILQVLRPPVCRADDVQKVSWIPT